MTAHNHTEYKIEKRIPIPARIYGGAGRPEKYPWGSLRVGESFFVGDRSIQTVSSAAGFAAERHNAKYTCRTVDGGVRVWRVK